MIDENASRTVVVADDILRHWLRFAFAVEGVRVCDYGGGALRNEAAKGQPGYAVIEDTFPDLNSLAPLRRLRRARELPALTIGRTPTGTLGSTAAPAGICIVAKPLNRDKLIKHVRTPARLSPFADGSGAIC